MRSPLPIVIIIIAGVLIWATFSTGVNGQAEEEQVFVDLLRNLKGWPESWKLEDIANRYSAALYNTLFGRVLTSQINYTRGLNPPSRDLRANFTLEGRIPDSITLLSSLSAFGLPSGSSVGSIPAGLWTMPTLMAISLSSNGISGTIPDVVTPTLVSLDLRKNGMSGTIPAALSNVTFLALAENNFRCPIAPELVAAMRANLNSERCKIRSNDFDIVNDKLCGTYDMMDFDFCPDILPTGRIPKKPSLSGVPSNMAFQANDIRIEVEDDQIYLYGHSGEHVDDVIVIFTPNLLADCPNNSISFVERREYVQLDLQGYLSQLCADTSYQLCEGDVIQFETFRGFTQVSKTDGANIWRVMGSFTDDTITVWEFNFDAKSLNGKGTKVSFEFYNWEKPPVFDTWPGGKRWQIQLQQIVKLDHSSNTAPMTCKTYLFELPDGFNVFQCQSDIASASARFLLNTDLRYEASGTFMNVSFTWPLNAVYIDDDPVTQPVTSGGTLPIRLGPLAVAEYAETLLRSGRPLNWTNTDQYFTSLHYYDFPMWNTRLRYDPDMVISLFAVPGEDNTLAVGLGIGLTAAVVVVAVVISVAVPSVREKLFPFMNRSKASDIKLMSHDGNESPEISTWQASSRPTLRQ